MWQNEFETNENIKTLSCSFLWVGQRLKKQSEKIYLELKYFRGHYHLWRISFYDWTRFLKGQLRSLPEENSVFSDFLSCSHRCCFLWFEELKVYFIWDCFAVCFSNECFSSVCRVQKFVVLWVLICEWSGCFPVGVSRVSCV